MKLYLTYRFLVVRMSIVANMLYIFRDIGFGMIYYSQNVFKVTHGYSIPYII